jgi:hypothetical protein
MFDFELEEVLSTKRVTIRAIVDPRDGRGWSRVVARSVLTSNSYGGTLARPVSRDARWQ